MRLTALSLVAAAIVAVGWAPRSSEFCMTMHRWQLVSCCCTAIRDGDVPGLTCCVTRSTLLPAAVTSSIRGTLAPVGSMVVEPIAFSARDAPAASTTAGRARVTTGCDAGRVLCLRI